jgi:hypothetical protein
VSQGLLLSALATFVLGSTSGNASIGALSSLTPAADKVPYFTSSTAAALTDFTSFGRSLVGAADASAAKTLLTLVPGDVGLGNVDNTSDATKNAAAATLTNKTINASANAISNLTTTMFASNVVDTDGTLAANSDSRISSQKAIKSYAVTGPALSTSGNLATFNGTGGKVIQDSGYSINQSLNTTSTVQHAAIELGHASDTTISRVSAGLIAVEGNTVAMLTGVQAFGSRPTFAGNTPYDSANIAAISPTWTGTHTYNNAITAAGGISITAGNLTLSYATGQPIVDLVRSGTLGTDYPSLQLRTGARYDRIRNTTSGLELACGYSGTPSTLLLSTSNLTINSGNSTAIKVLFQDNGSQTGGIGSNSSYLAYFNSSSGANKFYIQQDGTVLVTNTLAPVVDNSTPLGGSGARWTIVYATTGSINTSDMREKFPFRAIRSAELRVADEIIEGLGFYKWKDAVAKKGERKARWHFGAGAQNVVRAFKRQGLNPALYGMWGEDKIKRNGRVATRQSLRPDELALFLIKAQNERLAA